MVRVRVRFRIINVYDGTSHSAYTAQIKDVTDLTEDVTAHIAPVQCA